MSERIRVMIVDDHTVVREALAHLLGLADDIEVVALAGDAAAAVTQAAEHRPQVVLMDVSLPGADGAAATRDLVRRWPSLRVVGLTSSCDRGDVLAMLDAGAIGYLLKEDEPREVLRGIRAAAAGGSPIAPRAATALLTSRPQRSPLAMLTGREREVLGLLATGCSNRAIAQRLGIREATVKAHLTRVFQALDVPDRTAAALRARELGLD